MALHIYCLPLLVKFASSQNILSLLNTLNSHLDASQNFSSLLPAANNFTFLATSNAAFDVWLEKSAGNLTEKDIEATNVRFLESQIPQT
jgi:hypothetical protein